MPLGLGDSKKKNGFNKQHEVTMKTFFSLLLIAPILSACVTNKKIGEYTASANDLLATCTSYEVIRGMDDALANTAFQPVPETIADGVIERCDDYFKLLEESIVKDGDDLELAKRVASDARVETRKDLIVVMNTN